jgi:hypothetical protein
LQLLQERVGNTLDYTGTGNNILNRTPKAQQLGEWVDKWNYMKLKSFCTMKERNGHQTEEAVHRMRENLCQLCI